MSEQLSLTVRLVLPQGAAYEAMNANRNRSLTNFDPNFLPLYHGGDNVPPGSRRPH
jgi:hypothetical protein